jgi:hypothetical protein
MPVKLPAPELGTEAQAAPKSMPAPLPVAIGDEDVIGALEVVGALLVDVDVLDPLELHAARPVLSASAATATAAGARRRLRRGPFTGRSLL